MPRAAKTQVVKAVAKTGRAARDRIDTLIADLNKHFGDTGAVQRGAEIAYRTWERATTGCLGLDMIMGGGLPRAAIVQFKGEESTAKTTMAMKACAAAQRRGEVVAWGAAEGFDKHWCRLNGAFIPYNEQELMRLVERGRLQGMGQARELAAEYVERHKGYGDFILATDASGPVLLEKMSRIIRSGVCNLAVLDSAGAILSEEDDEKDIGDATRVGGNCKILGHFVNKVRCSFHRGYEAVAPDGVSSIQPNKSTLIIINQVRAVIGQGSGKYTPAPEGTGGFPLKHGKDVDIRFNRGELMVASDGTKYGREVVARCEKNKTAAPFGTASWHLYFKDMPAFGIQAGTIDTVGEVFKYAVHYDLIKRAGAWYTIGESRFMGAEAATNALRADPSMVAQLHNDVLEIAAKGSLT